MVDESDDIMKPLPVGLVDVTKGCQFCSEVMPYPDSKKLLEIHLYWKHPMQFVPLVRKYRAGLLHNVKDRASSSNQQSSAQLPTLANGTPQPKVARIEENALSPTNAGHNNAYAEASALLSGAGIPTVIAAGFRSTPPPPPPDNPADNGEEDMDLDSGCHSPESHNDTGTPTGAEGRFIHSFTAAVGQALQVETAGADSSSTAVSSLKQEEQASLQVGENQTKTESTSEPVDYSTLDAVLLQIARYSTKPPTADDGGNKTEPVSPDSNVSSSADRASEKEVDGTSADARAPLTPTQSTSRPPDFAVNESSNDSLETVDRAPIDDDEVRYDLARTIQPAEPPALSSPLLKKPHLLTKSFTRTKTEPKMPDRRDKAFFPNRQQASGVLDPPKKCFSCKTPLRLCRYFNAEVGCKLQGTFCNFFHAWCPYGDGCRRPKCVFDHNRIKKICITCKYDGKA